MGAMSQTVTTIKELMPHLAGVTTARDLGVRVIALVPQPIKHRLALEARDRLGMNWTDKTVRWWLMPSVHTETRAKSQRAYVRRATREWYVSNPGYHNAYHKERRKTDPAFRVLSILRNRVNHALNGRAKTARTVQLIGCSVEELMEHIERQFTPGMSWANLGEWEVDHRAPCASFDLLDPEQQKRCFHWSNLQPLWKVHNRAKGSLHRGKRYRQGRPR